MTKKSKKSKKIVKKKDKKIIRQIKSNIEIREIKNEKHLDKKTLQQSNNEFNDFIQSSTRISAPVLDKVTNAPQAINLEEDLAQDTSPSQNTERQFDYSSNINQSNYTSAAIQDDSTQKLNKYQSNMAPPILRSLSEFQDDSRVQFLDPLAGMRGDSTGGMEPQMIETRNIRTERETGLPFEDKKRKYKEVRF